MRVLVTGATGFLGGALTRLLLARDHAVIAAGRSADALRTLAATGAHAIAHDLSEAPPPAPAPCDAFVHCAALSSPWGSHAAFVRANVDGTRTALDWARRSGARRFVQISTPSLYFRFRDQIGVREDAALPRPINAYAATKRRAEELVLAANDLDPIVLRPRGLYGPGDTTLLPRLIAAARARALPLMNEGRAATDLTHVEDVAEAVLAALSAPPRLGQRVFNVSGGVALNICAVAERACARAGVTVRWRRAPAPLVLAYAHAAEAVCGLHPQRPEPSITAYGAALFAYTQTLDISAAHAHLGWRPRIGFEDGLDLTFAKRAA